MKFLFFILGLIALLTTVYADEVADCRKKSSDIAGAIEVLCGRNNLMAGGRYRMSTLATNVKTGVAILATSGEGCNPPQYVPSYWCRRQFYNICARNKNGFGKGFYGTNSCQLWTIYKTSDKTLGRGK